MKEKGKKKKTQEIICIFVLVNGFLSVSGIVGLNSMWELLLIGRLSMSPICSIKFPTELFVTWQSKAYTTANSGFFLSYLDWLCLLKNDSGSRLYWWDVSPQ